jgi:hypothetical protein
MCAAHLAVVGAQHNVTDALLLLPIAPQTHGRAACLPPGTTGPRKAVPVCMS